MTHHPGPESEVDRLRQELETCHRELAQTRESLEFALEDRFADRHRREEAEARLVALSESLERRLSQDLASSPRRSLLRRSTLDQGVRPLDHEVDDLDLLKSSTLLDGPWYLREHPEVAESGLSPALHYLRRGAALGWDPGPDFHTKAYRAGHPEIGEDVNPLVHHLRSLVTTDASAGPS